MSKFCEFATTSEQCIKDDRYYENLCRRLGTDIAEKIYSLCSIGEKIVSISKPKTVEIYEPYTVEVRMYCDIADLVRCKDCKHYKKMKYLGEEICVRTEMMIGADDYCSYGERRNE